MNNEQNTNRSSSSDRDLLDQWLMRTDPLQSHASIEELHDAEKRLDQVWLSQAPLYESAKLSKRSWSLDARLLSVMVVAATLLIAIAWGLYQLQPSPKGIEKGDIAEVAPPPNVSTDRSKESLVQDKSVGQGSVKGVEKGSQSSTEEKSMVATDRPVVQEIGPKRIVSVEELLKLNRRQLAAARSNVDRKLLNQELGEWLLQWDGCIPSDRLVLASQWNKRREIWLPMLLDSAGRWEKVEQRRASLELILLDQSGNARTYLAQAIEHPNLRSLAWPTYLKQIDNQHCDQMIRKARSCEELQAAVLELAQRPAEEASRTLALVAATPGCGDIARRLNVSWRIEHRQWALNRLSSANDVMSGEAAALLAIMDDPKIDDVLGESIASGRFTVASTAALMLRRTDRSRELLGLIRKEQALVAGWESASQQVNRWLQNQVRSPFYELKVCKPCDIAS